MAIHILPPSKDVGVGGGGGGGGGDGGVYGIHLVHLSIYLSISRQHGFWSTASICFGISISNFIETFPMPPSASLSIFMA